MNEACAKTREILLGRQGLIFVEPSGGERAEDLARATEIELAALGYVPSRRLRDQLARIPAAELGELKDWICGVLAARVGGNQEHRPLFRRFPDDIPANTLQLWLSKVICHFTQEADQPCVSCRRVGTTHVLDPCLHVVCDHCFDGSTYTACPVCEHHVDRSSPFFAPMPDQRRDLPDEPVRFRLLDLGDDLDASARALFDSFCARPQAMSTADRGDLAFLVKDFGERVIPWLPERIPVKENVATIFGTLFLQCEPSAILPQAKRHLATATDLLRLIAVYSGADPALQREKVQRPLDLVLQPGRWWGKIAEALGAKPPGPQTHRTLVTMQVHRFKVAPLRRPLRRALLAVLEGMDGERLIEDLLRHREYWLWVGRFLHPHEYAKRFPKVARAFCILRQKAPDGTPAPVFRGFHSRLEAAAARGDASGMTALLSQRPGELARRLDHALRVAGDDLAARQALVAAFCSRLEAFSTPVLLTLCNLLPTRLQPAQVRIFWPKGKTAKGVSSPDRRPPLSGDVVRPTVAAIEEELLRRYAALPHFATCIVDEALRDVAAPFNERTASPAAVALPRGSRLDVPSGKIARLFLHWCQPEQDGWTTDLDLSVGFFAANWEYVGVCSYYQLRFAGADGRDVATSAGDLQDAPYPDGATEFVDLHLDRARELGIRWAVMVVNSYSGMPFSALERGFAGLMLREDPQAAHFDPRTVELRFDLQGERGIYLPLAFDIVDRRLHWLDTYSKGELLFNNVATSTADIRKLCPEMITYFGSGVRMSLFELALLHAAARGERVLLRGEQTVAFARAPEESAGAFLQRLRTGAADETDAALPDPSGAAVFAALFRGNLDLPAGSTGYALFRERVIDPIAASDLIG